MCFTLAVTLHPQEEYPAMSRDFIKKLVDVELGIMYEVPHRVAIQISKAKES